jgi:hypothetical protein
MKFLAILALAPLALSSISGCGCGCGCSKKVTPEEAKKISPPPPEGVEGGRPVKPSVD